MADIEDEVRNLFEQLHGPGFCDCHNRVRELEAINAGHEAAVADLRAERDYLLRVLSAKAKGES